MRGAEGATQPRGRLALAALVLLLAGGGPGCCLPGFAPLMPKKDRVKVLAEPTGLAADEAYRRLTAWFASDARTVARGPHGPSRFGPAIAEPGLKLLKSSYHGFCSARPADGEWRLEFDLEVVVRDRALALTFRDVRYQHPKLGDNPGALQLGHKRAPQSPPQLEAIATGCLQPLAKRLAAAVASPPQEGHGD